MEDIKAKQQKLPIDRVAEKNIYEELKAQYDSAKQTGYGYRHESDLDAIFSRQAGILAAGGLKSVYDIGTRPVERSSVIKAGSSRPDYQVKEDPGLNIQNVRKYGDNYYYDVVGLEGSSDVRQIDPARILDVQEDLVTVPEDEYGNPPRVVSRGLKIQVKDDPRIELINKRTNAAVNDIELHNEWREDPLAYNLLNKPMEVETNPYRGFNKINTNYGVRGAADLSFQMVPDAQGNQVPLILPIYRSTSTDLTPLIIAGTLLAGGLYFGPGATAGAAGTGAATGATAGTAAGAGAATGAAIVGTPGVSTIYTVAAPSIGVSTLAPQAIGATGGLLAADAALASGGAPISTATAVPAGQLAYPAVEVAAIPNASLAPTSFQAALPGMGIETAASAAPFTAAPGSFQAALPSLLAPAVTSGIGLTDALRAANSINSLLNPPTIQQQAGLPQAQSVGGGQARGVDFSPLYQNSMVGLLPLAERYRRSLI
jgi:hypothetical protein